MLTRKEYYEKLQEGEVKPLEELAIRAGYSHSVQLEDIQNFRARLEVAGTLEERARQGDFEPIGGSLGTGMAYADPINYLRGYEEGFVRTNGYDSFVALGVLTERVIGSHWNHSLQLQKRDSPRLMLYRGSWKEGFETESFLNKLQQIGGDERAPRTMVCDAWRPFQKVIRNAILFAIGGSGSSIAMSEIAPEFMEKVNTFLFQSPYHFNGAALGILAACAFPLYTHRSHYSKRVIKKLTKLAFDLGN